MPSRVVNTKDDGDATASSTNNVASPLANSEPHASVNQGLISMAGLKLDLQNDIGSSNELIKPYKLWELQYKPAIS